VKAKTSSGQRRCQVTRPAAMSRRGFLICAGATGITLAFVRPGPVHAGAGPPATARAFEPSIWYQIDVDGIVTVNIAEAEMGQHVGTALARILADELEADWDSVRIRHVDTDAKWGKMLTGGSWSVWDNFDLLSRAGAAGRVALIDAGARLLDVPASRCSARSGTVICADRAITYAEIVRRGKPERQFSARALSRIPLKKAAQRRLIGTDAKALDVPCKTDGSGRYGIDAAVEGMLYARPVMPPTRYGSRAVAIDDGDALKLAGYAGTRVLQDPSGTVPGWVVVYGESYPVVNKAVERIRVQWEKGAAAGVAEQDLLDRAEALLAMPEAGALVRDDAGVDQAFATAASTLERSYLTDAVLHFQLEPVNALVFEKNGHWEVHTGNQWQSLILPVLAKALEVPQERIVMRTYLLGGGFGRRLYGDYAVLAALASKAIGRPVKLLCTREDDARLDCFRSPSVQRLRMAFDQGGVITAMEHHAVAGWPTQAMSPADLSPGLNGRAYDQFSINGANHWYDTGKHRVRAVSNDLAMRSFLPGWLRSVGPGWTNWALESFMDETAQQLGKDPLALRLQLLKPAGRNAGSAPNSTGGASRQAQVLRRAAEKSGWGHPLPVDVGLGIATTFGQERAMPTWTACVARVRVDRRTGKVTVEKLTVVIDAGIIVQPDGARAQVEGATLWGLSLALHEGTRFHLGQVQDTNLNTYTPLRIADVPELDIELLDSDHTAVGLGEPATTVVAPAVGNAIFAAVGVRVRRLPIRPAMITQALRT
jgi:isoquinoline 1-oxidoreductase beta subunit